MDRHQRNGSRTAGGPSNQANVGTLAMDPDLHARSKCAQMMATKSGRGDLQERTLVRASVGISSGDL